MWLWLSFSFELIGLIEHCLEQRPHSLWRAFPGEDGEISINKGIYVNYKEVYTAKYF